MSYVIVRSTRLYVGGVGYTGSTCQVADVAPGVIYENRSDAYDAADRLSEYNLVGFDVVAYKPRKQDVQTLTSAQEHHLTRKPFCTCDSCTFE